MSMSKPQRIKMLAQLWPAACRAQGWKPSDHQKRYAIFAQVLGHVPRHARTLAAGAHISFNHFDNADFDRVKAHLQMLAGNLAAAIETDHPELGHARRLTTHARMHHVPLLIALFSPDPEGRVTTSPQPQPLEGRVTRAPDLQQLQARAETYLSTILKNRFKVRFIGDLSPAPTWRVPPSQNSRSQNSHVLPERGPSQLTQYLYTVSRAIDRLRAKKKWSRHDLYTRARLPCDCLACSRARPMQARATLEGRVTRAPEPEPVTADSNHPF